MLIRVSRLRGVVVAVAGLALLAGCAAAPAPLPGVTGSTAPTPAAPTSPGPTPSEASPDSIPLTVECSDLISAQAMFDFNPNFAALPDWSPEAGTPGATAIEADGVACRWVSESGGASVELAVSRLGAAALADAITDARGTAVELGDQAFFSRDADDRGMLTVFSGSARLVISSEYFGSADDAAPLVDAALGALS